MKSAPAFFSAKTFHFSFHPRYAIHQEQEIANLPKVEEAAIGEAQPLQSWGRIRNPDCRSGALLPPVSLMKSLASAEVLVEKARLGL
jgi:hypothetical protein